MDKLKSEARIAELRGLVGKVASGGGYKSTVDTKNVEKPFKLSNMKRCVNWDLNT